MTAPLCCIPVTVPLDQLQEAINIATDHNPSNQIPFFSVPADAINVLQVMPEHIAVMKRSYWGPKGVNLGVQFLDNPTQGCRNKILKYANVWGQHANIKFSESANGEVRLSRTPGSGYWSYLGTDILTIKNGQPTMNLDSFTEHTPDREYSRVVTHEFGHTLGFPHEHMRKEIVANIDPQKAYSYFKRITGWSQSMVQSQVLTPLPESQITGTSHPRANSIMCYQLPGEIMKDGKDVPGGLEIDIVDHDLARKLYPCL